MSTPHSILAWHWLAADRRLGCGDGRLVEPGQTPRALDLNRPLGTVGACLARRAA